LGGIHSPGSLGDPLSWRGTASFTVPTAAAARKMPACVGKPARHASLGDEEPGETVRKTIVVTDVMLDNVMHSPGVCL
jgi:hypothetical protein